jgi:hypothetical protein
MKFRPLLYELYINSNKNTVHPKLQSFKHNVQPSIKTHPYVHASFIAAICPYREFAMVLVVSVFHHHINTWPTTTNINHFVTTKRKKVSNSIYFVRGLGQEKKGQILFSSRVQKNDNEQKERKCRIVMKPYGHKIRKKVTRSQFYLLIPTNLLVTTKV